MYVCACVCVCVCGWVWGEGEGERGVRRIGGTFSDPMAMAKNRRTRRGACNGGETKKQASRRRGTSRLCICMMMACPPHRRLWLPAVWVHASAVAGRGAIGARLVRVAALRVGAAVDGVEQVHLVRGAVRVVRVVRLRGYRQPDARVRPLHLVAHGVRRLRHAIPRAHPAVPGQLRHEEVPLPAVEHRRAAAPG